MKFNYLDFSGKIYFFCINGFFFKFFFNLNFIYQFIVYYISFYRCCLSSQKSRSFINFSKKKLRNQKGSGKARVGSANSPTRRSGARAFPNLFFENYKKSFNKNSYKICFFFIYSNLFFNNYFFFLEDLFFLEYKTKISLYFFKNFFFDKVIFLSLKIEKNFFLSLINLNNFRFFYFFNFNPLFLIKFSKVLITRSCFNFFND